MTFEEAAAGNGPLPSSSTTAVGIPTEPPTASPASSNPTAPVTASPASSDPTASPASSNPTASPASSNPTAAPASSNPTTPPPTEHPTAAPSDLTSALVAYTGDVSVVYNRYMYLAPTAIYANYPENCSPTIISISGFLYIANNHYNVPNYLGLVSMEGAFSGLREIGSNLEITGNYALVTMGDGFAELQQIGGVLQISNHVALTSLGTAFSSLERAGSLQINGNPLLTDFEALRNLRCHGGSALCENCPAWLTNKPRC